MGDFFNATTQKATYLGHDVCSYFFVLLVVAELGQGKPTRHQKTT